MAEQMGVIRYVPRDVIDAKKDSPLVDFRDAMQMLRMLYPYPASFRDRVSPTGRPSVIEIFWSGKKFGSSKLYREVFIDMRPGVYKRTLDACRGALIEMEQESLKLDEEGEPEKPCRVLSSNQNPARA